MVPAGHQIRRELLTPVLLLAALCLPGCRIKAQDRILGSLGNGLVDFSVRRRSGSCCCWSDHRSR